MQSVIHTVQLHIDRKTAAAAASYSHVQRAQPALPSSTQAYEAPPRSHKPTPQLLSAPQHLNDPGPSTTRHLNTSHSNKHANKPAAQERGRGDGDDGRADVEALAERPVPVGRERERGVRGGDRERARRAVRDDRDVRRVAGGDVRCGRAKRGGEGEA